MNRVVNIYPNFANRGGAQDVVLQLAEKLNFETKPIVLTETNIDNIVTEYKERAVFIPFNKKNILKLHDGNTVFLSHHRKNTTKLVLINLFLKKKLPLIHIAHNTFNTLKWFSRFPNKNIAVSNAVKDNLIEYFKVPEQNVKVIFNGMTDKYCPDTSYKDNKEINILLPGRICPVKQQIEIANRLKESIPEYVHISFAGAGEDVDELKKIIANSKQLNYVGFLNIAENIHSYDYVCLFSKNEGLPLSLIEGCMFGKPLITNDIKAVLDVNKEGETGFVFKNFEELSNGLKNIPTRESDEYKRLSANARKRYEQLFTEDRMISQYKQVITELINN